MTKLRFPRCLINHIFDNYLDIESIRNLFKVLPFKISFFTKALKGFKWNFYNDNLDIVKWLYYRIDNKKSSVWIKSIELAYIEACRNGKLNTIKWIDTYFLNIYIEQKLFVANCKHGFIDGCANGHLKLVKWMDKHYNYICFQYYWAFDKACLNNKIEIAKWIYETNQGVKDRCKCLFVDICKNGYLQLAEWFLYINDNLHNHYDYNYIYITLCGTGPLCVVEWLESRESELDYDTGFYNACTNGNLEVAKHIVDRIIDNYNYPYYCYYDKFIQVCKLGYLNLAKWLYGLNNLDIKIDRDYVFTLACENNQFEIAKWLLSIYNYDLNNFEIEKSFLDKLKNNK